MLKYKNHQYRCASAVETLQEHFLHQLQTVLSRLEPSQRTSLVDHTIANILSDYAHEHRKLDPTELGMLLQSLDHERVYEALYKLLDEAFGDYLREEL